MVRRNLASAPANWRGAARASRELFAICRVDIDEEALHSAEHRRTTRGDTNVTFHRGEIRSLVFERAFDAAVGRFVLLFIGDPTATLKAIANHVRPGGIVVFHEWAASLSTISPELPVLGSLMNIIRTTFERSGARLDIGLELHSCMREVGLQPGPRPLTEIALRPGSDPAAHRRWSRFAESLMPKIVEYGLANERDIRNLVEGPLRDELLAARVLVPLSWPMIGQWARKPDDTAHGDSSN